MNVLICHWLQVREDSPGLDHETAAAPACKSSGDVALRQILGWSLLFKSLPVVKMASLPLVWHKEERNSKIFLAGNQDGSLDFTGTCLLTWPEHVSPQVGGSLTPPTWWMEQQWWMSCYMPEKKVFWGKIVSSHSHFACDFSYIWF